MNMCQLVLHLFQAIITLQTPSPENSVTLVRIITCYQSLGTGENVSLNDSRPGRGRACNMNEFRDFFSTSFFIHNTNAFNLSILTVDLIQNKNCNNNRHLSICEPRLNRLTRRLKKNPAGKLLAHFNPRQNHFR
jgi:hypothetical protein